MAELVLSEANFDQTVLQSSVPVLVDFWAPWCGPCRLMGPIVEDLSGELDGKFAVGKVNVDDHGSLAQRYHVMSIPTFIVFKGGKQVDQFSGAMAKDMLKARLEKFV